jgi:DNA invertase Pin-like site-specific DNA recombinase
MDAVDKKEQLFDGKPDNEADASSAPRVRAYSYIRMSTKEQLQGDSLRRQYEKAEFYARENTLELVENYDDIGVSAFRGANELGRLGDFLAAVKSNLVTPGSHLIVESMDRLTRQTPIAAISTFNEIIMRGIVVVTLDDGMRYSAEDFAANQYKLFIAVGAMMRAHDESLRKSGLLSDTWAQKRKQLAEEGKVLTSVVPAWLRVNKSENLIEQVPERVAIIKEIFDLGKV